MEALSIIGCDMDGVVCNFVKAFSTRANRLFPDEAPIVDYMDVESWKWDEWYAHSGIIEATWKSILTLDNGNFWLGVEPLYNMDYLREIYNKHPIVFITRRDGGNSAKQTHQWLENYGMPNAFIIRVKKGEEKSEHCKLLKINVMIDDSPKYAQELLDSGIQVVMPTYQYNVHLPKQPGLHRVFNLERALKVAEELHDLSK